MFFVPEENMVKCYFEALVKFATLKPQNMVIHRAEGYRFNHSVNTESFA